MARTIGEKLKHAWNAFTGKEEETYSFGSYGAGTTLRPGSTRTILGNERSIITSIYNRISIDIASIDIRHVRLDSNGRYSETIDSGLNYCLTTEANIDQEARAFRQDIAQTMLEEGVIAVVPVDTTINPDKTGGYDIKTMRVGRIVNWYPRHVRVDLYNDRLGKREEIVLPKETVAIIENPLYSVMNEPNSTLRRLIRKINLLDIVDEQTSAGKLDIIIQLPYTVKSDARRKQAEQRRDDIELQLRGSQYGIAYADATERITQLNRPAENNLLKQVEYLTNMLYGQLGITQDVLEGTADEKTMLNYHNRTVEPILAAIVGNLRRTFLTKTARTQGQSIQYFRDPFKSAPISDLAEIADKFTRNEILTSNEIRAVMGMSPSSDPVADELRNKNLPKAKEEVEGSEVETFT